MDFRLTDEELLRYNLLEAPFFSIPMPFALATYVAHALDKADLESMSMDAAASVLIFKHLLIEHAMNNHPHKEKTND